MQESSFYTGHASAYWDEDKKRLIVQMKSSGPFNKDNSVFGSSIFNESDTPVDPTTPDDPDQPVVPPEDPGPEIIDEPIVAVDLADYELVSDWTFSTDDTTYNDVTLPHTYNATDDTFKGVTYYKSIITINSKNKQAKFRYLVFSRIGQRADIFVNDTKIATVTDGFNPTVIEVGKLDLGYNTIKVVCDNSLTTDTIPAETNDKLINGLYGLVYMYTFTGMGFDPIKYGKDRMHISTSYDNDDTLITAKRTLINRSNNGPAGAFGTVVDGEEWGLDINIMSAKTDVVLSTELFMTDGLKIWDGLNDPKLYDIDINFKLGANSFTGTGGTVYDKSSIKYGIRKVEIKEDGFYLNGKSYPLRGVVYHLEDATDGGMLTNADIDRDIDIMKDLKCNFVRVAYCPGNDYFLNKCDEVGIIVQMEIPWISLTNNTLTDTYKANIKTAITDMITNYYNHPSIVFWGLSTEMNAADSAYVTFHNEMYDYAKSLDDSRFIGFNASTTAFTTVDITTWSSDYVTITGSPTGEELDALKVKKAELAVDYVSTDTTYPDIVDNRGWLVYSSIDSLFDYADASQSSGINEIGLVSRDRTTNRPLYTTYKSKWTTT